MSTLSGINPATGLQGSQKTPALPTNADVMKNVNSSNDALYGGASMGLNPDQYPFHLSVGSDNQELRAQNQSIPQEVLFGTGRLVGTTATKFLEGFGYGYGAAEALFTSKTIGEAVDNGWTNFFGNAEEAIKEQLPIHHTRRYLEGNILQQMGTLGFWMDDAIDGVAFLASAYLGSAGINVALKGAKGFTALGKAYARTTKAVKAGKAALAPQAVNLSRLINTADLGVMTAFNSVVEAGFESKDIKDQMLAQGYSNQEASEAAKNTFGWNVGALMLSNYVTNSMFFGKANPMAGRISNIVDPKTGRLVTELAPLTKGQKIGAFAKAAGTSAASEGPYEENIQLAIQNYFGGKTDKTKAPVEGILGEMLNNFTTNEGQKAIVLGSLIGLIPGGVGGVRELKAEKAGEKTLHTILGSTINKVNEELEKYDMNMYEGEGENKKLVIDPDTKKPVKDPIKVASYFADLMMNNNNFNLSLIAAENGNEIMMGRLEEARWSSLALSHVFHPDGLERFKAQVDMIAKDRIEKAKKDGVPIDEKAVLDQARKTKGKADYYKTIYDNIANNYAGLYNFHESGESGPLAMQANLVKDKAIEIQYQGAIDQMFWTDTIHELETERAKYTDPKIANQIISKEKVAAIDEQIKNVEEVLAESEKQYKTLMSEEFWQKKFDQSKARIEGYIDQNKPVVADEKATPLDEEGKLLQVKDKDGKGYEYKGTNAVGNHILNDGKTDIILTPKQLADQGIVLNDETNTPLASHLEEVKASLVPEKAPAPILDVIEDKQVAVENASPEEILKARKDSVVEELSNRKVVNFTGAETTEEAVKQSVTTSVAKTYADQEALNGNLAKLFEKGDEVYNVVYGNEHGTLFIDADENEVVFKSDDTGKEIIIGKTTDEELYNGELTLLDLGIIPLHHTIFDIEVANRGNQVIVQGRTYNIFMEDPTSTVETDTNGMPVAITLYDVNGTAVRFTNPTLVEELAYTMELIAEARAVVEDTYLNNLDADFVVVNDPRITDKNVKYYVYKQPDGSYKVVKPTLTEEEVDDVRMFGTKTVKMFGVRFVEIKNEKFKGIIMDAYFNDINRIINEIVDEKIKLGPRATTEQMLELQKKLKDEINKTIEEEKIVQFNKQVKNETEKLTRNSRPATEEESLKAPGTSEVSSAKDEKRSKTEEGEVEALKTSADTEQSIKKAKIDIEARKQAEKDKIRHKDYYSDELINEMLSRIEKETGIKIDKKKFENFPNNFDTSYNTSTLESVAKAYGNKLGVTLNGEQFLRIKSIIGAVHNDTVDKEYHTEKGLTSINNRLYREINEKYDAELEALNTKQSKQEKEIVEEVAETKVKEAAKKKTRKKSVSTDTIGIEPINEEFDKKVEPEETEHPRGLKHTVSATAIKYEENGAADVFFSNPDLDLSEYHFEVEVEGKYTAAEIDGQPKKDKYGNDNFDSPVDTIIINLVLVKNSGQRMPFKNMFIHRSDYDNIVIPNRIKELQGRDPAAYRKAVEEHVRQEKEITRAFRHEILKDKLEGKRIFLSLTGRGKGVLNQTPGINRKLTEITKNVDTGGKIAVTDSNGSLYTADGNVEGTGGVGNVFWVTNETVTGEEFPIKLNVAKVSERSANIILNAYVMAADKNKLGYATIYESKEVEGEMTVGDIVRTLVLEGPITDHTSKDRTHNLTPTSHLIEKQLWMDTVTGILHYGRKTLNVRKEISAEDRQKFVDWITTQKNYVVPLAQHTSNKMGLGENLKKDFRIGDIVGKKGDSYQSFLIRNGMVLTDATLDPVTGRLFSKPVVIFETEGFKQREEPLPDNEKPVEPVVPPVKPVVETKVEPEQKETFKVSTAESFAYLTVGTELYSESEVGNADKEDSNADYGKRRTVYGKVIEADGKKVFVVDKNLKKFVAEDLEPYDGMELTNPSIKKLIRAASPGATFLMASQPVVVTKKETKQVVKEDKPASADEALKKLAGDDWARVRKGTQNYTLGDVYKATKWLRKKFGNKLTVKQEEELLRVVLNSQNFEAFGTFNQDAITLSKKMEEGTEYHEAYHRVELMFLSPEQRAQVHEEARVRYGLRKASETEVSEVLAEEYRSFELKGGKSNIRTGKIKQFFQDLWDFIRTFITGQVKISNLDIDNLFRVINKSNGVFGRLQAARPNKASMKELGNKNYLKVVKGRDLAYVTSAEVLSTVVQNLVYETLLGSGVFKSKDVSKIDFKVAEAVMLKKGKEAEKFAKQFAAEGKTIDHDIMMHKAGLYNEIVDNYDIFLQLMRDHLETLGVRTILPDEQVENPEDEKDNAGFNFQRWDRASFELDGKDTAGTAIKFTVATLPSTRELDPITGMRQFVEFDDMWDTLQQELYKYDTVEEMVEVLKSKTAFPYQILVSRLEKDRIQDRFDTLRTQFLVAMRKNRYSYDHGLINKKGKTVSVDITSAETQRVGSAQSVIWGQNFFMSDMFVDGKPVVSKLMSVTIDYNRLLNQIKAEYKSNPLDMPSYEKFATDLIELLNRVSVNINREVLDNMLNKYNDQNRSQAMYDMVVNSQKSKMPQVFGPKGAFASLATTGQVKDTRGRERQIQNIFKNEQFFNEVVAPAYLEIIGGSVQNTILGPGGNTYHLVSENSYLTDVIRELTNVMDPQVFNQLIKVGYNQGSWLLSQMIKPEVRENMSVGVFSAFSMKSARDKGRGFEDLTPVENILLQMALLRSGEKQSEKRIPLPQLGDRRHLYMIKGLSPIDFTYVFDPRTKELRLPGDVVSIFIGYAMDEYRRIQQTQAEITEALAKNTEYKLRENYHFKLVKGKRDYTKGNGLMYQHFTGFNGQNVTESEIPELVRQVINARIADGVQEFANRGIITLTAAGKIGENKMMDNAMLAKVAEKRFGDPNRIKIAIENEIANYTLNSIMATIESEKLVFMDPAYYANLEDKIKRYTAIASTGPTGRLRIDSSMLPEERLLHDSDVFKTLVLATQSYDAKAIREELETKFAAAYELQGYTKAEAEKEAKRKARKYANVDPTDGQAYITPEMFRAIHIRMGEWSEEKEAGYALLSKEEYTPEEQREVDKLFMQPLKYMFFGPTSSPGVMAPVYYKMSLATLTPQLVKGTQLQALYDRMTDVNDPVDMVPFDSAVKVGRKVTYKYYSENEKGEVLTDVVDTASLAESVSEPLQFKFLRKQVETEPHNEVRTFVGTQFRKLVLSNIVNSRTYHVNGKPMSGELLKAEYAGLVAELSDRGKAALLEELGVDANYRTIDPAKMKKVLMDRARSASMSDALIDALSNQIDGIDFEYDALPDRKWVQSTLISIMSKKTVDLKLPGTSLIQMTNFGLRKANKDNSLKLIDKDGFMEAKVSVEIFRDVIPNYDSITHEERLKFANTMFAGVGYRIPTQGLNSIVPLKIVGFLPATSTATITLPSEFTALTGSDFDIDKLYFVRHNYDIVDGKAVKVEYVEGGENSKRAVENRLVDMYFGVLLSNEHVLQNWVPLDASTDVIKDISKQIQELEGKNKEMPSLFSASFIYQSSVKDKYLWGKKGIAPFARANVHHVLGQIAGIHLNRFIGVGNTVDYNGRAVTDLSQIMGVDGELIQDWLSALISANVDIAKDPYIFDVNVNLATYNVAELLIRSGVGVDTFWFLSQPVLKDYAAAHMDAQGKIKADWSGAMKATKALYETKMKSAAGYVEGLESNDDVWNKKRLQKDIDASTKRNAEFYARQLQILNTFNDLRVPAQFLFESVNAVQVDTKRYGNSLTSIRAFQKLHDKVLRDNVIVNMDKVFELTFLGALYENSVELAQDLFKEKDIMSSEGVIALHDQIMAEIGRRYDVTAESQEYIADVSDEIYSNIVGKFMVNAMGMSPGELRNMMFGEDNMPSRLNKLKNNPKYVANPLIKLLAPNMTFSEEPDFIITFAATDSKTKWAKDRITEGWMELLTDNDPVVSTFAKDLVKYAFYTSGFKRTLYSIYNFIPPTYLKEIGFSSYMGNMRNAFNSKDNAVLVASLHDDVFRHMWNTGKDGDGMVPFLTSSAVSNRRNPVGWEHKYPMMFQVKKDTAQDLFLGRNMDYDYIFVPFVKIETNYQKRLYRYIGYRVLEDGSISPVYAIDSPRGYYSAGKVVQENGLDESIFENNNTEVVTQEQIDDTDGVVGKKEGKIVYDYSGFVPVATENRQVQVFKEDIENLEQLFNTAPIKEAAEEMQKAVAEAGITDWTVDKVSPQTMKELRDKYAHCK